MTYEQRLAAEMMHIGNIGGQGTANRPESRQRVRAIAAGLRLFQTVSIQAPD
jgi:hypothetical protein